MADPIPIIHVQEETGIPCHIRKEGCQERHFTEGFRAPSVQRGLNLSIRRIKTAVDWNPSDTGDLNPWVYGSQKQTNKQRILEKEFALLKLKKQRERIKHQTVFAVWTVPQSSQVIEPNFPFTDKNKQKEW